MTFSGLEVMGYGQPAPETGRPQGDFPGRAVRGKLVMYLPGGRSVPTRVRVKDADRGSQIIQSQGAGGVVVFEPARVPVDGGASGRGRGAAPREDVRPVDITTVERVDAPTPPNFAADETFFDFVFSGAATSFQVSSISSTR